MWAKLCEGGTIRMAFHETFWRARFGMLNDKFGIDWHAELRARQEIVRARALSGERFIAAADDRATASGGCPGGPDLWLWPVPRSFDLVVCAEMRPGHDYNQWHVRAVQRRLTEYSIRSLE